jgi:hypothetical protein
LNSGVGAVVLNKTVDVSLKEIVKDLTPVQAPKSTLDNGPALAPIKLDVKASSKSNSVPAIIQMDASPVAKENVDNPFAQSASPYPLIKKKSMGVISEDILVSYSVPSNSPLPKISEEQLLTSVPSSKQNIQSFQLITPISSALDSGERNRVGALPYNIPVQGSYPNTGLGSKDILKQVSDVSPIMGSDIRLDTVVVPSVSLASVVDVASIVDTVQTQKVRTELTQEYRLEFGTSIIPYEERVYRYPSFPKYSDNDNHRKRSKGIGDIFTFTAFRTTSAPKQTGVEKQVVRAKLVNFYPSTGRKVPDALKKQKGSNEYFRAVTIDGVHGIGEFQGTNQSVGFYPAGSSSGSGWNVPDKQRRKKR